MHGSNKPCDLFPNPVILIVTNNSILTLFTNKFQILRACHKQIQNICGICNSNGQTLLLHPCLMFKLCCLRKMSFKSDFVKEMSGMISGLSHVFM